MIDMQTTVYPKSLSDSTYKKLLGEKAYEDMLCTFAIAQFTSEERKAYEDSIKYYRDLKNSYDTAHQEGLVEGLELGRQAGEQFGIKKGLELGRQEGEQQATAKMVRGMQANGLDIIVIAAVTGLSETEIRTLLI
jgi:predicted transposase/invertase (TIGR01784 family)